MYHFLMKLNKTCHSQAPKTGYVLSSSLHARHTLHCQEVLAVVWPGHEGQCCQIYTVKKIGDDLKEVKTNLRFFGLS